jgi:hypothetical protein
VAEYQILNLDRHYPRDRERGLATSSKNCWLIYILQCAAPSAPPEPKRRTDASCTFLVRSNSIITLATEKPAFTESKLGCLICILVRKNEIGSQLSSRPVSVFRASEHLMCWISSEPGLDLISPDSDARSVVGTCCTLQHCMAFIGPGSRRREVSRSRLPTSRSCCATARSARCAGPSPSTVSGNRALRSRASAR